MILPFVCSSMILPISTVLLAVKITEVGSEQILQTMFTLDSETMRVYALEAATPEKVNSGIGTLD